MNTEEILGNIIRILMNKLGITELSIDNELFFDRYHEQGLRINGNSEKSAIDIKVLNNAEVIALKNAENSLNILKELNALLNKLNEELDDDKQRSKNLN